MRKVLVLSALVSVLVAPFAFAAEGDAASKWGDDFAKQLDRYIGRFLAEDGRATMAEVRKLLPESCPPFYLRDEFGRIIDPTINPDVSTPVSTRQTCGAIGCHDVTKVSGGYHFQMGKDELRKEPGLGEPIPIEMSPGLFGKWDLMNQRQLAPKTFSDPDTVDLTAFDWVKELGVFHPGGGPAEFDRGDRNYAEKMASDMFLAYSPDGDYYDARWYETGVVEPDCFICHLDTYHYSARAQQLKKLNYRWAATEASGIAVIEGSIADGDVPKVHYKPHMFGHDGKVSLHITRPGDRSCLTCHDILSTQKRGSSWHSQYMQDVHTQQGVKCIDCHQGDIRHNFGKGFSSNMHARDDLDGTAQSCEQCHYETNELGAPAHEHKGITKLHMDRLGCETCHITKRPFLSARVVDTVTGRAIALANRPGETANRIFGANWGTVDTIERDAMMEPIPLATLQKAAAMKDVSGLPEGYSVRGYVERDGSGIIDAKSKRRYMLRAVSAALGLDDDSEKSVVCIFRGRAYRLFHGNAEVRAAELQPKRVGDIVEYPVTYAWHEVDGEEVMQPEGYQLGSFWVFRDGDIMRPLFLREMKAAWDFLNPEDAYPDPGSVSVKAIEEGTVNTGPYYEHKFYPATPYNDEAPAAIPSGPEGDAETYAKAVKAKMGQYKSWKNMAPPEIGDDNMDMQPELNTDDEMGLMGWALVATNPRLAGVDFYYIRGERVFKVTVAGTADPYSTDIAELAPMPTDRPFIGVRQWQLAVVESEGGSKSAKNQHLEIRLAAIGVVEEVDPSSDPQLAAFAQPLEWNIAHGVEPASMALGANGCTDCHSMDSDLFFNATMVDPFGTTGDPVTEPSYKRLGYSLSALSLGAWREGFLKPLTPWAVLLVLAAIVAHFTMFGSKKGDQVYIPDTPRFNFVERFAHLGLLVSVVYLCVTGFCFMLGQCDPLGEMSRTIHALAGYVAGASFIVVTLCWLKDMFPAKGDAKWMMGMGGYLGGKGHYPAGKFNAGQKMLFWIALAAMAVLIITGVVMALNLENRFPSQQLVYTVHDAAAFVMILLLLGHIYLAAFVNPHCMWTLFGGKVSAEWAKEHHPDWKAVKK